VVEGSLPVNYAILYNLQDVFNLLPNLEGTGAMRSASGTAQSSSAIEEGKRPFTVATNDQLLVLYLSSLIRAVIALHDLCVVSSLVGYSGTDFPIKGQQQSRIVKQ